MGDILHGRVHGRKLGRFQIQEFVVESVYNCIYDNVFQYIYGNQFAVCIGVAGDGHFQFIIMPVAMRIIALAEEFAVGFVI